MKEINNPTLIVGSTTIFVSTSTYSGEFGRDWKTERKQFCLGDIIKLYNGLLCIPLYN